MLLPYPISSPLQDKLRMLWKSQVFVILQIKCKYSTNESNNNDKLCTKANMSFKTGAHVRGNNNLVIF